MEIRKVESLVWREDLYPRFEPDSTIIQKYAEDIGLLPPIEINQHNEIIDGYHRWTAHKKAEVQTISVTITETSGDRNFARLAMRRNSTHGFHISNAEKKDWLLTWYTGLNEEEKRDLAEDMGVSLRTVKRWTQRKDKDLRARRKRKAFDMWLSCETLENIGETLQISKETSSQYIQECQKNDTWHKSDIFPNHSDDPDWKPPIYDVWKQQKSTNKTTHPAQTEAQWIDNLLYMYTESFDIVVDPFGGGGSTVDVCKKRLRRYWVSDRLPIVERRDIRQHDILQGPPDLHKRWGDVSLLYLDPPYWKQAEGKHSEDEQDLGNMDLEQFYNVLTKFISECAGKMCNDSHVALIIQPTQWRAPNKQVVDHIIDLIFRLRNASLEYNRRIVCPYETQQYNPQQVDWAKENKDVLVLSREIIIWQVKK